MSRPKTGRRGCAAPAFGAAPFILSSSCYCRMPPQYTRFALFCHLFAVKERLPEPPAPFLPHIPAVLGKGRCTVHAFRTAPFRGLSWKARAHRRPTTPHSPVWGLSLGIPARHRPASASPAYSFEATQDIFHFPWPCPRPCRRFTCNYLKLLKTIFL